jgi:cellulose synthase/poly-beta-1,6-N-acetylglucosamine synthase-like glycosyltransferase
MMLVSIEQNLARLSPRLSPKQVPAHTHLVHAVIVLLWFGLFIAAFDSNNLWAWSAGLFYLAYDSFMHAFILYQTWPLRTKASPSSVGNAPRARVAALIAARNEAKALPRTLQAIFAQSRIPDIILIADDGSQDDTPKVMAAHYGLAAPLLGEISGPSPTHPGLYWLRLAPGGKARALNQALARLQEEALACDIVLTIDADTILEPTALAVMVQAFESNPNLVAATGILQPVCDKSFLGRIFQTFQHIEYIENFLNRYAWMGQRALLLVSGAFAGFRAKVALEVGGFDPHSMVEDYEIIHRIYRYGHDYGKNWQVQVLGQACARTDAPARLKPFLQQRRRWFGGFLQTQYWNRDMVANPRYKDLGMKMLIVKALDTLQPLYGLMSYALLLFFAFTKPFAFIEPILLALGIKIALDMAFTLWSLFLYSQWTGISQRRYIPIAMLAIVLDPFSFTLVRHWGALLGWSAFLTNRQSWASQRRLSVH